MRRAAGLHGGFVGACLIDNGEVEGGDEKMVMWYEEGLKRSRSEG